MHGHTIASVALLVFDRQQTSVSLLINNEFDVGVFASVFLCPEIQ